MQSEQKCVDPMAAHGYNHVKRRVLSTKFTLEASAIPTAF